MGRSHAVRLAEEGADLILVDICESLPELEYPLSTREDLAETARLAEKHGSRVITHVVDVRDSAALAAAVGDGVAQLGGLDASVANAGVLTVGTWDHDDTEAVANGVGRQPDRHVEYVCSRDSASRRAGRQPGQHQLVRGPEGHAAAPAVHGVQTRRGRPEPRPGQRACRTEYSGQHGSSDRCRDGYAARDLQEILAESAPRPHPDLPQCLACVMAEAVDISNAVLFLVSDESRYVTGLEFKVDAGVTLR